MTDHHKELCEFTSNLPEPLKHLIFEHGGWRGLFDNLCSEYKRTEPQAKINFIREMMMARNVTFEWIATLYYNFTMSRPEWHYRAMGLPDALHDMALYDMEEALTLLQTSDWPEVENHRKGFEKHVGRLALNNLGNTRCSE